MSTQLRLNGMGVVQCIVLYIVDVVSVICVNSSESVSAPTVPASVVT